MGRFIWYELMTREPEAAKAFYRKVVGWEAEAFDPGDMGYCVLQANGRGIGGILPMPREPREAGAGSAWLGYVAVEDVDAAAQRIVEAGGQLHRDIVDIPTVGRIAMVSDPQGAPFYLIAPEGEDQPPPAAMSPGHVGWHELHTSDWRSAFGFYAAQFGWEKAEAMEMGPMGTYQIFTMGGGDWAGGMFAPEGLARPFWLLYFVVGDIDEAAERVRSAGGEVLQGPREVPGGAWIIQCHDPEGVSFALAGWRDTRTGKGEEE